MSKRIAVFVMLTFTSSVKAADLPLIGLDENNKPVQMMIDGSTYQERVTQSMNGVQQAALPVLAKQKATGGWAFNTFLVGVGVSFDIGLSNVLRIGAVPRFRLLFTNVANPAVP